MLLVFSINSLNNDVSLELLLENSRPHIGAVYPSEIGIGGETIKIAVIDTGVNFEHPDLLGIGENGKIVGGYDFIENDNFPQDTNGHGTQVAGIIAADGETTGIAPKSKILAYRVSEDGEAVSSDLIIKAIKQAMADEADIINISLGVDIIHDEIDYAVNEAVKNGIVVVAAAGNSGPDNETIGSPGANPNAITVGATYNDIDSSIVSTLQIGEEQFQVLPMLGTEIISEKIIEEIEFGGFGREQDLEYLDVKNKILLVERGGEVEDEVVFFSEKEYVAANSGAKAIIVFNNEPGIFYGELMHEFIPENYVPSIPAVSITQDDGLKIKKMLNTKTIGTIDVFNHPDFVAMFSSRGPVSPFYGKPDLVAPGVFVKTTSLGEKYNITSGTSYAAPHIAGAVALLLEKNPEFTPHEIKSKLITTSNLVTDPFGNEFPMNIGGAGRVNVTDAFNSELLILPSNLRFDLSTEKNSQTKNLHLNLDKLDNQLEIKFSDFVNVNFDYNLEDNFIQVTSQLVSNETGEFEGRLFILHNGITHQIPIHVRVSDATVNIIEENDELFFEILKPLEWTYAKISAVNKETLEKDSISFSSKSNSPLKIYKSGDYWIEAKISTDENTFDVYDSIKINLLSENEKSVFYYLEEIERPVLILSIITVLVGIFGVRMLRN
ncbi:MAG: S8 family serine peptidase [Candidatus Nitrosopelagicus sp.]|nr:S8 family serine peptidase [Candidatus Nitrosopelagicus sp.]